MNRRHLALIILLNALISLAIAVSVVWVAELRRPDTEELAALAGAVSAGEPSTSGVGIDLPPVATLPAQAVDATGGEAAEGAAPAEPAAGEVLTTTEGEPQVTTGEPEIYVVQVGESLGSIADKLGVSIQQLVETNALANPDVVFSGQRLIVPGSGPAAIPTAAGPALGTTGLKVRTVSGVGNIAEEYVEIVNDTDLSFNLQGWRLQKAGGSEYTFGDLLIFPGGSLRLYTSTGTNTTITRYWGLSEPVWGSGATVVLINAQAQPVTEYAIP